MYIIIYTPVLQPAMLFCYKEIGDNQSSDKWVCTIFSLICCALAVLFVNELNIRIIKVLIAQQSKKKTFIASTTH